MFTERHPTKDSPGLQYAGVSAKLDALIPLTRLAKDVEDLRLTTPIIHVVYKFANRIPLDEEEQKILPSLTIPRGSRDWIVTPLANGRIDGDTGILSLIEIIKMQGILETLPKRAEEALNPDQIMFCGFLRWQPISVLWDIVDGIHKASPFGSPKPWVVEELEVLGLITVGQPVSDGTKGRPPRQLNITSWGARFVELTRRHAGFEISDAYRRAARRRAGNRKPRLNLTDKLVSGYLSQGQQVPDRIKQRMSEYGRQELSKAYGVEL